MADSEVQIQEQAIDQPLSGEELQQFEQMREPPKQVAQQEQVVQQEQHDDDDGDDEAAQDQQGKQPPRRVNYNKFLRVENRAKTAETERDKLRENYARVEERLKLITEALQAPQQQQQEEGPPDPEQDIFGFVKWLANQNNQLREQIGGQQRHQQESAEEQQITGLYETDARTFLQQQPDFPQAYNYLMQNRAAQLALYMFGKDVTEQGVSLSPREIQQIRSEIAGEERALVTKAITEHQSPAKMVYSMARAVGFRPQKPNGNGQPQNGQQQNGQQQQNGKTPNVGDEIARIKQGSEAALSLSQGGAAPNAPLTAERLATMDQDEFGALLERMSRGQLQSMLGA